MSDSIEPGHRICVGLPGGKVCALSPDMTLDTDRGPIKAKDLPKLWRNQYFGWITIPTMMSVSRETEHEWQEDQQRDVRGEITIRNSRIAYVAEETSRE